MFDSIKNSGSWRKTAKTVKYSASDCKVIATIKNLEGVYVEDYFYFLPKSPNVRIENIDGMFVTFGHIPTSIYQTYSSQKKINTSKPELKRAQLSWLNAAKEHSFGYHFYDDVEMEKFMCDNFSKPSDPFGGKLYEVFTALDGHPPVMKADVWRYAVIYLNGGIYADIDTTLLTTPLIFLKNAVDAVMVSENDPFFLCQWFFAAPPGSEILKSVLDAIIRNYEASENTFIKDQNYIHHYTGPAVYTLGFENYLNTKGIEIESDKRKYHKKIVPNFFIFENENFHSNILSHHFNGDTPDGWKAAVAG